MDTQQLGRMSYDDALARQRATHRAVVAGEAPDTLLIVEHEPVITITRKPGVADHLLAGRQMLESMGIAVAQTDRGGDITYHGPGQLVVYPIIRLNDHGLNLRQYVWLLEQAIIDTLRDFEVEAARDACAVGVWVPMKQAEAEPATAKIAAIGVRAARWVTMHGLALNVAPDLEHFRLIVPCGLAGRSVTSMRALLGTACPSFEDVRVALVRRLAAALDEARDSARSAPQRR